MSKLIHSEEFDVAYLNSMYSPRFTIMPLFVLNKMGKKVIIAPRGMLAPTAIAIKSWKKKPFLFWLKNKQVFWLGGFDRPIPLHFRGFDQGAVVFEHHGRAIAHLGGGQILVFGFAEEVGAEGMS